MDKLRPSKLTLRENLPWISVLIQIIQLMQLKESPQKTGVVAEKFATSAVSNGIEVLIAAAGKAAHLAGVMAAFTPIPVIGIPIKSSTLDGLDSLLSTVQMPKGIPVATVAIDGAENAALLAIQILSLKYPELQLKMIQYKEKMAQEVIVIDNEFQKEKKR